MSTTSSAPAPVAAPSRVPRIVSALALVSLALILGPVIALSIRVPWAHFGEVLTDSATQEMLRVTLPAALISTLITTVLGVCLALFIQRLRRGGHLLRLLVLLPLAMPPVVGGLALTAAVGRRGLTSPLLDALGLNFAFAFPGVVLAHVFIALPFVVVTVDAALRQIDSEILHSAAGVGMRPGEVLRRVVLPALSPAVATGAGLAFARSLGEFGTTLTFAGSMPGVTRTMPLGIYLEREIDQDRAFVLGAILILLAVGVLALAAVPTLLRREPVPSPRPIGPLDADRLRALTAARAGGVEISVSGTKFPARVITAVVGPNGSGKSTLMGVIAGRLSGPEVAIAGRAVAGVGVKFCPPAQRGVVLLTQRPGLPRTATVAQAITMATRDQALTTELLDAAGLRELTDVAVPALSGGQAAQVALVRALGVRPAVLILDEPLASIDHASAARWRRLLQIAAADRTTILVTHDALDIAGLSTYLVVLEDGEVFADGPTAELLELPPNDFVSGLVGLNRLPGIITRKEIDTVTLHTGELEITGISVDHQQAVSGKPAVATFEPEAVTLRLGGSRPHTQQSARNSWPGVVESVSAAAVGSGTIVTVDIGPHLLKVPITRSSVLSLGIAPGVELDCVVKATAITIHPV
ncbi:ATP-binding cassette domain-containing protein [Corynebacterium alimapuense]|uniref:ABC transporter n=1 Tax=Corynebacterium alimapuense TaxID=1576874 RepID=A0A3M8K5C9_9CORY|nr:ATP-binding cassette domain-containing protein [Corynebacterium alimapuense]RNE48411.1 ABC transporter [Corynebacterium alimapuense]